MYVCVTLQFKWRAGYPACADCEPFVVHLAYYSGMDDKERSRCLATLHTHGRLPTSDLAVETMTLALLKTAVTMQCTLAFGECPDSWLGSESSSNSGSNFSHFAIFPSTKDAVVQKEACHIVGRASNVRLHACECVCTRPSLHIHTFSIKYRHPMSYI